MPKNISIKEVGVAQNVSDVAHIKVSDVESGDIDFVPESDVTTVFKAITANGTYLPSSDLGDGYIAVLVDVPVKSLKGKDKTTGKTYEVSVDPTTGEIEKTEQSSYPDHIHIVIPPTKRTYNDGDTIDFSGIHVYLMDENNHQWISDDYPTGEIPFNELTFPVTTATGGEEGSGSITGDGISDKVNYPISIGTSFIQRADGSMMNKYKGSRIALFAYNNSGNIQVYIIGVSDTYNAPAIFLYGYSNQTGEEYLVNTLYANQSYDNQRKTVYYSYANTSADTSQYIDNANTPKSLLSSGDVGSIAWTLLYGTFVPSGGGNEIPVQWSKDGGAVLEDTFEINVASSENPSSGSSSDSSSGGGHSSGDF